MHDVPARYALQPTAGSIAPALRPSLEAQEHSHQRQQVCSSARLCVPVAFSRQRKRLNITTVPRVRDPSQLVKHSVSCAYRLVTKAPYSLLKTDSQPVQNVESTLLLLLCNSTRLLNSPTQSSLLLKPLILPTTFWFTVLFRTILTSERYSSFQPPLSRLSISLLFSIYFP